MPSGSDSGNFIALQTAAESYLALGWSVIPVLGDHDPDQPKAPAIKWRDYQRRRPTMEQLQQWFADERYPALAIITGAISQLAVLDFDDPERFQAFQRSCSHLADTRIVETRRGFHLYYHVPPHLTLTSRHTTSIDLHYNRRYVIAPPSVIDGHEYKLIQGGQPKTLSEHNLRLIERFLAQSREIIPITPQKPQKAVDTSPGPPEAPSRSRPSADLTPNTLPEAASTRTAGNRAIRIDPELGRLATAINMANLVRFWAVARFLVREGNGSGKVAKSVLRRSLKRFGVTYTRQHYKRLLQQGEGLFWNCSPSDVYIRSWRFVSEGLTRRALEIDPDLVTTNRPGVREVYLSPAGSLEQWQAMLYAGWMAHRNAPTISRTALSKLFGRSEDTLRRWEQTRLQEIVTVRKNYAQSPIHDEMLDYLPAHQREYVAMVKSAGGVEPEIRVYWRLPNTYQVAPLRQHPKRGQGRKVRKAVNQAFGHPADERRGGMQCSKRYFDSGQRLRVYVKQHGGVYYLWRGENRHHHGMWEPTEHGFPLTFPDERAGFRPEREHFKALEQKRYRWLLRQR